MPSAHEAGVLPLNQEDLLENLALNNLLIRLGSSLRRTLKSTRLSNRVEQCYQHRLKPMLITLLRLARPRSKQRDAACWYPQTERGANGREPSYQF